MIDKMGVVRPHQAIKASAQSNQPPLTRRQLVTRFLQGKKPATVDFTDIGKRNFLKVLKKSLNTQNHPWTAGMHFEQKKRCRISQLILRPTDFKNMEIHKQKQCTE